MYLRKHLFFNALFLLFHLICLSFSANAQENKFNPILVGDSVPDFPLTIHIGNASRAVHFKDFEGKLVIFDFWGVYCGDCIAQMTHMLELQNKFKNRIQIFVVTKNSYEQVKKLFKELADNTYDSSTAHRRLEAGMHLPFITEDSVISSFFPNNAIPSHVWIDELGIFRAQTYFNSTTSKNIELFLNSNRVKFANYHVSNIDWKNPFDVTENKLYQPNIERFSIFMKRIEYGMGVGGQTETTTDSNSNNILGFSCINRRILDLYKLAFFQKDPEFPDYNIYLDVKNCNQYYFPEGNDPEYYEWANRNLFCYFLRLPSVHKGNIFSVMQKDLNSYFGFQTVFKEEWIKCFIVKRRQGRVAIKTKFNVEEDAIIYNGKTYDAVIKNKPWSIFYEEYIEFYFRQKFGTRYAVVDETGIKNNIDMSLPYTENFNGISFDCFNKALGIYGLEVKEEYRKMKVLVIDDKKIIK